MFKENNKQYLGTANILHVMCVKSQTTDQESNPILDV